MVRKELLKIKSKKVFNNTLLGKAIILIAVTTVIFFAIYLSAVALAIYNLASVLETL